MNTNTLIPALALALFAMAGQTSPPRTARPRRPEKLAGRQDELHEKCEADAGRRRRQRLRAQATEKKLAGAKTSFMKKCEADAGASSAASGCEARTAERSSPAPRRRNFVKEVHADAAAW